ncbi:hypothetical protein L6452_28288 [Arctium lappa]|uniref:Uncharacterized protein n=1 Tax=Arctium lappa TaxID=4217 RepID=A0ACB8ZX18_ARCLA|nr:hypothetical protein L6452_28288 [Arctium lappa]
MASGSCTKISYHRVVGTETIRKENIWTAHDELFISRKVAHVHRLHLSSTLPPNPNCSISPCKRHYQINHLHHPHTLSSSISTIV